MVKYIKTAYNILYPVVMIAYCIAFLLINHNATQTISNLNTLIQFIFLSANLFVACKIYKKEHLIFALQVIGSIPSVKYFLTLVLSY